ncbi:hypothetical protein BESB_007490 [Besnoitia besnoiti]|uniref:Transmembrane protein n=1 Tax=Besnoitia besnoiti TaxID=94643 RepID=A0A2A9MQD4_BESBE|nr:hypothetical protein BESB_007490 [Besnoitia besnoiti]PFH38407.1 hypothetical protein BESB_007490 [Besnoitia besnoiti]
MGETPQELFGSGASGLAQNSGAAPSLGHDGQHIKGAVGFKASATGGEAGGDISTGVSLLEQHLWTGVAICFVALVVWVLGKCAISFADKRAMQREAEGRQRCHAARMRYVERLEGAMEEFKKTEEFEKLEKESADRERGIQPEHRRTWQSRGSTTHSGPAAPTYRPNVYDRYQMQRGRGG